MRIIEITYPHDMKVENLPETVTAIGFFDGIHKGHQEVIQTAIKKAERENKESAVITFHPHPSVVLRNKTDVKYITPTPIKKKILEQMGIDRLYIITFNKQLSALTPQSFIDHFIIGLNIKHVVAGFDFSFGHMGKGNMSNIVDYSKNFFTTTTIDKVTYDEEKISSTRIRKLLELGDVERISTLLGRPYLTIGNVIEGDKRGRAIGYPTANIQVSHDSLLPKPGIYAVKVTIDGQSHDAMASLGTNPTFTADKKDLSLEINILDYNSNIYGKELEVEWFKYIRDEIKFSNVELLIEKIQQDEQIIRSFFKR